MGNGDFYGRVRELLGDEARLFAACSSSGRMVEWPGVIASVVAAAPDRSMFNWVVHKGLDGLLVHYPAIAQTYADAGVRAWTVWVDPGDADAAEALSKRGHLLDSQPVAMAAEIAELRLPETADLDWIETRDMALVGRINDNAYGFPPPAFEAVLDHWAETRWHAYIASLNGIPAGSALAHFGENGDCGISGVATLPEARGHGIATRLLAVVLGEARRRGMVTTSLQASPAGAKVYSALGYRNLGVMGMWERRQSV
jgi:GNAT superfamily N-acetyltransferase